MKKNNIGFGCLFVFLFILGFSLSAQENVSRQTVLNTPSLLSQAKQRMDATRKLQPRQERVAGNFTLVPGLPDREHPPRRLRPAVPEATPAGRSSPGQVTHN